MTISNSNATALTTDQIKAIYTGSEELEGFPGTAVNGLYWVQNGVGLFQPNDSTKVFNVEEDDITLSSE